MWHARGSYRRVAVARVPCRSRDSRAAAAGNANVSLLERALQLTKRNARQRIIIFFAFRLCAPATLRVIVAVGVTIVIALVTRCESVKSELKGA